jgi:hypothetical protein
VGVDGKDRRNLDDGDHRDRRPVFGSEARGDVDCLFGFRVVGDRDQQPLISVENARLSATPKPASVPQACAGQRDSHTATVEPSASRAS